MLAAIVGPAAILTCQHRHSYGRHFLFLRAQLQLVRFYTKRALTVHQSAETPAGIRRVCDGLDPCRHVEGTRPKEPAHTHRCCTHITASVGLLVVMVLILCERQLLVAVAEELVVAPLVLLHNLVLLRKELVQPKQTKRGRWWCQTLPKCNLEFPARHHPH